MDAIPPTYAALLQHVKRAAYMAGYCWGQALIGSPNFPLRNRACRNASLVNANFSVNQMCPIICWWKPYCFGDNRRTKDNRKIKLCGLKACCVTLISCSISPNFPSLKRWNEKSEA